MSPSDLPMRPVTLAVRAVDGSALKLPTAGLVIAAAPGLLVTPWYVDARPVRGRFTLTHAASGVALVALAWCPHDVRRWAVAAGWIGVNWEAPGFTITASGPAATFAFRLCDEWRPHCEACPPVPPVDRRCARALGR